MASELFPPFPYSKILLQSQVDTALLSIRFTFIPICEGALTRRRFQRRMGVLHVRSLILSCLLDIAYSLHGAEYLKLALSACSRWLADASEKRQKSQSTLGP